ncbi:LapA family protein [Cylindrospermum sp. FACHB-282]|uniref:LapA family protein n=1 Tax=Cylindrospermum sp. FACHB-282 TaxID=2692794 RepID=UPI0016851ABA|nr:LapA family protein [Cylindrospermum sp. FACHB-282]MBD2385611.1 LapA family protein [Cylindrospermum sp. FACHB-282]
MAVIRLILLVVILGGLTLLLAQNWSPVLPLVFLGMGSQPLPLALWILFSTAAGAFTSILITTLFKLSDLFVGQPQKNPSPSAPASPRSSANRTKEPTPYSASPPSPSGKTEYTSGQKFDDWETSNQDDDWDFEEQAEQAPTGKTYEREQTPKSSSKSGSVYSYSYQEPKNTAVGKTESVYDADYRVIIPPYQPPTTNQADEDDWDFFEDEDEEQDQPPRR